MNITVPSALHVCPQCEQDTASGRNTINGEPRICTPCIAENVRNRAAMPYLKQSDEPEEQPEEEVVRTVPAPHVMLFVLICGFFCGVGLIAGYMIGRMQ